MSDRQSVLRPYNRKAILLNGLKMIRLEVGRNDREKLLPENRKILGKEVQNVYGNCKAPKIRLRLKNILIDCIFIIRF